MTATLRTIDARRAYDRAGIARKSWVERWFRWSDDEKCLPQKRRRSGRALR